MNRINKLRVLINSFIVRVKEWLIRFIPPFTPKIEKTMLSPVETCLEKIQKCNAELERLANNPEEAEKRVPAPGVYKNQTITKRNEIQLERDKQVNALRRILSQYNLGVRSNSHASEPGVKSRYLAFVDILGYSEIVRNKTHEELSSFVNFLIRDVQSYMTSEEVGKANLRLYNYGFAPDFTDVHLNNLLLSDTILFWTVDDSADSFFEIVKSIRNLMFFETYYINVALRGVITLGDLEYFNYEQGHQKLTINQSTLFGKAIVDAYHIEKEQDWLGCLVTPEAIANYVSQQPDREKLEKVFNEFLIEYNVPMKKGKIEKHNVIRWPWGRHDDTDRDKIKYCFTRHQKSTGITDKAVQLKYDNTVQFAQYVSEFLANK